MRGLPRSLALAGLLALVLSAPLTAAAVGGLPTHPVLPQVPRPHAGVHPSPLFPPTSIGRTLTRSPSSLDHLVRPRGFSPPITISTGPTNTNENGGPPNAPSSAPSVVDDSSGDSYVAFASNTSSGWQIYFTLGTTGGTTFSAPASVSGAPSAGSEFVSPSLALNAPGTEACITYLRTIVSFAPQNRGDYYETCSTNAGTTWSPPQTDNATPANYCSFGSLYDPVGAFDANGNYVVAFLCRNYHSTQNNTLTLGWDVYAPTTNTLSHSYGLPIASYTQWATSLALACGSASTGCTTVYSITDGTNTAWHLLAVTSPSDFTSGSTFGPIAIENQPVAGTSPELQVFPGGLAYASNGTLSEVAYLSSTSGLPSSFNVHFAYSTNGWASTGAIGFPSTPPAGPTASGLFGPALALEGSSGAPFLAWENVSGAVVYAAASSTPGGTWSAVQTLPTAGGWPALGLYAGGVNVWRADLAFDTASATPQVDYAQLSGPAVSSIISDHVGGEVGLPVNFTAIGASGGFSPYTYTWSSSPATGLGCLATSASRRSCVPTATGSYGVSVQLVDSAGFLSPLSTMASFPVVGAVNATAPVGWPGRTLGDIGQSVFLNTTPSGGLSPYTVSWSGLPPGCAASTTASVACTLGGPAGASRVVARLNDAYNYNATSPALTYTVGPAPTVSSLQGSPDPGQPQTAVTFSAVVTGGSAPLTYLWSFGHGTTSSSVSPSYTFSSSGSYPVWLNLTDAAGVTAGGMMTESIAPSLGVTATSAPGAPTAGQVVFLNATATGGVPSYTYQWNYGDGTRGTGAQVQHTYSTFGVFTATVFANDSAMNSALAHLTISVAAVGSGLRVSTATGAPNPTNTTTPVKFSVSASGGVTPYTFRWDFGDGSSLGFGSTLTHLFATPSSGPGFLVNCTVSDSASHSDSQTFYERVNQGTGSPPLVVGSLSVNPDPGEVDLPVTFSVSTQGGAPPLSFAWQYGDTTSSTGANPTQDHNYTIGGTYAAEVRVIDAHGKVGFANASVTIDPPVVAALSETPSTGAAPLQVQLIASATGGASPYVYRFSLGGLLVPSQPNGSFSHTFTRSGSYEILMVVTDSLGGSARAYANVSVSSGPGGGVPPPLPGPSGSWFSQPWLYLALIAILVVAIMVALGKGRRRPSGVAPSVAAPELAVDPDVLAPSAIPSFGASSDDTAEDGSPSKFPDRYPMLPPRREDALPSEERSTRPPSPPVDSEVARDPSSAPVQRAATPSSVGRLGGSEPVVSEAQLPPPASAPSLTEMDNQERSPSPTIPATAVGSTAATCGICGHPLQDGACRSCGIDW